MVGDEGGLTQPYRPVYGGSVDGVDAIQDEILLSALRGGLEAQRHGGGVGVEPAADVLDVIHQGVQVLHLLGGRFVGLAIEAVDRQAGLFVHGIAHLFVRRPADAVLWAKQHFELDARRVLEQVNGRIAVTVLAGMVGDQADAQSLERGELLPDENVNAVKRSRGAPFRPSAREGGIGSGAERDGGGNGTVRRQPGPFR